MRTDAASSSLLQQVLAAGLWLGTASQSMAQTARPFDQKPDIAQQEQLRQPAADVADYSVGKIGQRQKKDETTGIKPNVRIVSRISNRVQLRIRSRIDRDYNPVDSAATPFGAAEEQIRLNRNK